MVATLVCVVTLAAAAEAPKPDTLRLRTGTVLRGEFVAVEKRGRGCVVRFRIDAAESEFTPRLAERVELGDGTALTFSAPGARHAGGAAGGPAPAAKTPAKPAGETEGATTRTQTLLAAREGEYWRIEEANISLTREPDIYPSIDAFRRALVATVPDGAQIEILKQQGCFTSWLYVRIGDPGTDGGPRGWLLAESASRAQRTRRSAFSAP